MFIQWQPEEKKKGKNNFLKHNPASRCECGAYLSLNIRQEHNWYNLEYDTFNEK